MHFKQKIELNELETDLAVASAKVHVLQNFEKQLGSSKVKSVPNPKLLKDGMNAYLEEGRDLKKKSTLNPERSN